MKLDQIIREIREQEPPASEMEQAASRVRERLFPKPDAAPASTGAIRSCADFQSLVPSYLAGSLDPARRLLLEVHARECVGCRRAIERARTGVRQPIEFQPRRKASPPAWRGWAIAAS